MPSAAEPGSLWRVAQLRHDLAPFPGRLAQTWRIALVCALTTAVAMTYGIPEASISCYLVFFVMKPDAAASAVLAIAFTILLIIVVPLLFFFTRISLEVPPVRLAIIVVTSLILLYLGSASKLGELGGIIALVIAFVMSLLGMVPFGEAATRALLYAWLMSMTPMAVVMLVSLTIGRQPLTLLRDTVATRLRVAADALDTPHGEQRQQLREAIWSNQADTGQRLMMLRLFAIARRDETRRLAIALQESYRFLFAAQRVLAAGPAVDDATRQALAANARAAAAAFVAGEPAPVPQGPATRAAPAQAVTPGLGATAVANPTSTLSTGSDTTATPPAGSDAEPVQDPAALAWGALQAMAGEPAQPPDPALPDPFLRSDARSNPMHVRFAIKTTAAAVLCYLAYTALDWQGIHTAMITCYVAALGSVGDTVRKLVLRITGCLIGAALGVGSILFLIPHMTSIGSLMLLVFACTFIAAWVAVGNERVSYAGVQIALAFLLTVLQGFGPSIDMDAASDRIIGILLGNCVMYLMFTHFWPTSVAERLRENLRANVADLAHMARAAMGERGPKETGDPRLALAARIAGRVEQSRASLEVVPFESRDLRPDRDEVHRLAAGTQTVRRLCSGLLFASPAEARDAPARLAQLTADVPTPPASPDAPRAAPPALGRDIDDALTRLEMLHHGR